MGGSSQQTDYLIRNAVVFVSILILIDELESILFLQKLSRSFVIFIASLFGIEGRDFDHEIQLGSLILPWAQDCSGFQVLIFLWMVTLWTHRNAPFGVALVVKFSLCLPLSLLANTLRIFSLAAYRYIFFPEWESPQVHYFLGFICVLPFVVFMVPMNKIRSTGYWLELLYMAVIFAIVAPLIFSPGDTIIMISVCFYLMFNRFHVINTASQWLALVLWFVAAGFIAMAKMESLWLPWLIAAPCFVNKHILKSISGVIILTGTIPIFAMNTYWVPVVVFALVIQCCLLFKTGSRQDYVQSNISRSMLSICLIGLFLPFFLTGLSIETHASSHPPPGLMSRKISSNSYAIRVPGQSTNISIFWFDAFDQGRHHSLRSCLAYRGIELRKIDGGVVYTGKGRWMIEYFIHDGKLVNTYSDYLLATFSPFSEPGSHLIFEADSNAISADFFKEESNRIAKNIHQLSGRYR